MRRAIQYVGEFPSGESDAAAALEFLATQSDFIAGRLLPPANQVGREHWRVQTFHEAAGDESGEWLPDGCRKVLLLDSTVRACTVHHGRPEPAF